MRQSARALRAKASASASHGRSEYAHVKLLLEPLERGRGLEFSERVVENGAIPARFLGYIESAVLEALRTGPSHGFEVVDVRITVIDGSYHEVDSTAQAFQEAAAAAFSDAVVMADWTILEPILAFEVVVPEEWAGHTVGQVNSRRGALESMDLRQGKFSLQGRMPQAELPAFVSELVEVTGGRAICPKQRFSHYDERPDLPEPPPAWAEIT
jgi:elongation factor G